MPTTVKYPWSDLTNVEGENEFATAQEMLEAAGLDWDVVMTPMYRKTGGTWVDFKDPQTGQLERIYNASTEGDLEETGVFDIRKVKDGVELGIIGRATGRYNLFPNREVFAFADNLVDDGKAKFVAAGEQNNGARVFAVLKLHEGITVNGEDPHDLFLFLRTGHSSGTALSAMVIPFRLMCSNASPLALRTAKVRWQIPHTKELAGQLAEARNSLGLAYDYAHEFDEFAQKLMATTMTEVKVENVLRDSVDPNRPRRDEVVQGLLDTYHNSTTNGYQGTGYGVLQAVTEFYDHNYDGRRNPSVLLDSVTNGEALKVSDRATKLLLARASK